MKMIKILILATIVASTLNPAASVCARESDTDSDNEQENATAAQAVPITPEEIAEETRIEQFVAKKATHIVVFLPVNLVNIILAYTKPTKNEVEQANHTLIKATENNDAQQVVAALSNGAYIETIKKNNSFPFSPLQTAVRKSYVDIVYILLKNNADVNTIQGFGKETPLNKAVCTFHKNNLKILHLLLDFKANPNILTNLGQTPLISAIMCNNTEAVKILIAAGVNPDATNQAGQSAWQKVENKPKMLQAMHEGLAQGLSKMLLESDVLQQHVIEPGIVRIVNDYAALENK